MSNPTFVRGSTTLTFKAGEIQAQRLPENPRQRSSLSTHGNVRVIEISTTDERLIEIMVVALRQGDDVGAGLSGRDSLRNFIVNDLNWAENTFTFTDADGDAFTVRYWSPEFNLTEDRQATWSGRFVLREEV